MSVRITYEELLQYTREVLQAFGYSEERAELTARILVEADARGVASHGVARLAFYEANLRGGHAKLDAEPVIVHETPVSLVVDGNQGIGAYVADFSMRHVLRKAEATGTCFCAVRNSNHYGMAGLWAEMAAERNMVGMAFTNTRPCAIATFGKQHVLGTNPIAVAIPAGKGRPCFLLDMATTVVAHGKVEVCHRRNKPMPLGWAVDAEGKGTTDATAVVNLFRQEGEDMLGGHLLLGGEGEELGGHKGYGLALLVELLCSGLSMGTWSAHTFNDQGACITHFFGAFRLDLFGNGDSIAEHVGGILEEIRRGKRVEGQDRIYIHGEKETERRAKALAEGFELDDATETLLGTYAERYGLTPPRFLS